MTEVSLFACMMVSTHPLLSCMMDVSTHLSLLDSVTIRLPSHPLEVREAAKATGSSQSQREIDA